MSKTTTWPWGCCVPPAEPCAVHLSATETTVYLAGSLLDDVVARAEAEGLKPRDVVARALAAYLERPAA